jgi:SAM-dependent methyltransferase
MNTRLNPMPPMRLADPNTQRECDEYDLLAQLLPLRDAHILELGCGAAEKTRTIAERSGVAAITALEVDAIQHAKNLQITDLPKVQFCLSGTQAIPAADASFDIVLMFKSLHHVPGDLLDQAFSEIHRVLKPGGLAYLSEPVFAGEFNDVLRLFHDEQAVRAAAFAAIQRAIHSGQFKLESQTFFSTPGHFDDFADFEKKVMQVSHTQHHLSPELHATVRAAFMQRMTPQGFNYAMPLRVDLLRKPD